MRWVNAVFLSLLASSLHAQTREFVGGHLATPPTLDGKIEPDEYKEAIRLEGHVDSQSGSAAPEGGTFYLGYDARFVYFAAKLIDAQPKTIQATEFRTNVSLRGNDTVTLTLDPFGALSDFNGFSMNARGGTSLDIAGGRAAKREWLGDFASMGRVTAEGWEVEARIPWSVLRCPAAGPTTCASTSSETTAASSEAIPGHSPRTDWCRTPDAGRPSNSPPPSRPSCRPCPTPTPGPTGRRALSPTRASTCATR